MYSIFTTSLKRLPASPYNLVILLALFQNSFTDYYSNSQCFTVMVRTSELHEGFRILNEYVKNTLWALYPHSWYSKTYAWLNKKRPHDHLTSSWGRNLVWDSLKWIEYHSRIRKHSLCATTASYDQAPPFSSSAVPLSGRQSWGTVASCVVWHPVILGNPP
jgi:hypothetical protein